MRRHALALCTLFAAGILVGLVSSEMIHAQGSGYSTKQILKDDLNNIPGQEVLFFTSDWPPGFRLPWHIHEDGHEFVFVLEGEQTFEIDGVGTKVVKAGEVIHTPPNVPHYGRNATDKVSRTLVVRIKPKDKPITTEVKHD
jgi:quercetin dioxygenase-like cupin family protein